jgi:hypothetical protein
MLHIDNTAMTIQQAFPGATGPYTLKQKQSDMISKAIRRKVPVLVACKDLPLLDNRRSGEGKPAQLMEAEEEKGIRTTRRNKTPLSR